MGLRNISLSQKELIVEKKCGRGLREEILLSNGCQFKSGILKFQMN